MYFCFGRLFNPNKQCIDVDTKLFKGCVPAGLFHSIPHSATRLFFGFLRGFMLTYYFWVRIDMQPRLGIRLSLSFIWFSLCIFY